MFLWLDAGLKRRKGNDLEPTPTVDLDNAQPFPAMQNRSNPTKIILRLFREAPKKFR